jgi:hypothetical protein
MGQTNEQQRHFNEWPTSELHVEVVSIQINLKLLFQFFTILRYWNVVSAFQLRLRPRCMATSACNLTHSRASEACEFIVKINKADSYNGF